MHDLVYDPEDTSSHRLHRYRNITLSTKSYGSELLQFYSPLNFYDKNVAGLDSYWGGGQLSGSFVAFIFRGEKQLKVHGVLKNKEFLSPKPSE